MREISQEYAKVHNLRKLAKVRNNDISKLILLIERLKENMEIGYYSMDLLIFDSVNHAANIEISFWADNLK